AGVLAVRRVHRAVRHHAHRRRDHVLGAGLSRERADPGRDGGGLDGHRVPPAQDPADGAEPQGRAGVRARAVAAARRRARARGGARGARGAPAPAREGVMERGPGERSTPDAAPAGAGWPSLILGAFALVLLAGVVALYSIVIFYTWLIRGRVRVVAVGMLCSALTFAELFIGEAGPSDVVLL